MEKRLSVERILGHGNSRAIARVRRFAQVLSDIDWTNYLQAGVREIGRNLSLECHVLELARFMLLKAEAGDWYADDEQELSPQDDEVMRMYQLFLQFPELYTRTCLQLVDAWEFPNISESVAIIDYDPYDRFKTGYAKRQAATCSMYERLFGQAVLETPQPSRSPSPMLCIGSAEKNAATTLCAIKEKNRKRKEIEEEEDEEEEEEEEEEEPVVRRSGRTRPKESAQDIDVVVTKGTKKKKITLPSWALLMDLRIRIKQEFGLKSIDFVLRKAKTSLTKNDKSLDSLGIGHCCVLSIA